MTEASPNARVAGVDEAGRGPWAGPVTVAAVILDPAHAIAGLDDSKRLSARRREALFSRITTQALAWHIEHVTCTEIDSCNILQATLYGMHRAVSALEPNATHAVIDGNRLPEQLPCPAEAVVGGDASHANIGAASILAKVARDRYMVALDARHLGYGFGQHKGYGTAAHRAALARLGPCPEHRRSFAPVRACLDAQTTD